MKWICIDAKYIPVSSCVRIDFSNTQRGNEYMVVMSVEDVNGNSTKSTYWSKVDKISEDFVRNKFYDFIMDSTITLFNFYETCKMIECITVEST